jgi:hypothetical protein
MLSTLPLVRTVIWNWLSSITSEPGTYRNIESPSTQDGLLVSADESAMNNSGGIKQTARHFEGIPLNGRL